MPIKCHRYLSSYSIVFMFFVLYLLLTGFMIMYSKTVLFFFLSRFVFYFILVKSTDLKQDIQSWEQVLHLYPGLIEPIRESWNDPLSMRKIYMITPTKTRAEQLADLTRLAQTLYLVKKKRFFVS